MAGGYTPSANPNKRLYNGGSEWQDDIDGLADYYSTFFREYDAVIGRFNGVDPMAAAEVSISVYAYSGNNPINFNDPNGDYKAGYNRMPEWYGPRMRDVVEKAMSSYSMGSDWYGSGGGSYGDFKARFDYLGSTGWQKEQNAVGRSEFFSTLLSVTGDGFAPEGTYWWDKEKGGQLDPEFRILVHGTIIDGTWNTSRVDYEQNLTEQYRQLITNRAYKEAVDLIINVFPNEMWKNTPGHTYNVDNDIGVHLTNPAGRGGSITRYSINVLRYYNYGIVSFGWIVRIILGERQHMIDLYQDTQVKTEDVSNHDIRQITAYYAALSNTALPPFNFKYEYERKTLEMWKEGAKYNWTQLNSYQQQKYRKAYNFIINYKY